MSFNLLKKALIGYNQKIKELEQQIKYLREQNDLLFAHAKELNQYYTGYKIKNEKLQKAIDEIKVWYGCNQDQVDSKTALEMIKILSTLREKE